MNFVGLLKFKVMAIASKYKSKRIQTVCDRLFAEGDILYMVEPDGKQSKRLSVYGENRELLGTVSQDRYYQLIETFQKQ